MPSIAELKAFTLREPVSRRRHTVLRLETGPGVRGYGECGAVSPAEVEEARQLLKGAEATAYEAAHGRLEKAPGLRGAVNTALLDIMGKAVGAPVYQLLGGATRNKVRVMTALAGGSAAELTGSLRRAKEAGFRAFLVPVPAVGAPNQGQAFVRGVRRILEELRQAGGEDSDFVLDGGGRLTPGDAASLSRDLERFHLLWFDEPCKASNLEAVKKISAESVTPLGFGRAIHGPAGFQDLLRDGLIDVLRADIGRCGITPLRKLAALAETYYTAVAPYHDGGPIATAAALQLAASIPNFFIQQIPLPEAEADRRMRAEIGGKPLETARDGFAALPEGPGLGIRVNEEALEKYVERTA